MALEQELIEELLVVYQEDQQQLLIQPIADEAV